ncbi:hypothetical protein LTR17_015112 [Elasticomyces elasticus]|nr:hypothetical protein LTR17_015112 [Elasticomyces elasticus]
MTRDHRRESSAAHSSPASFEGFGDDSDGVNEVEIEEHSLAPSPTANLDVSDDSLLPSVLDDVDNAVLLSPLQALLTLNTQQSQAHDAQQPQANQPQSQQRSQDQPPQAQQLQYAQPQYMSSHPPQFQQHQHMLPQQLQYPQLLQPVYAQQLQYAPPQYNPYPPLRWTRRTVPTPTPQHQQNVYSPVPFTPLTTPAAEQHSHRAQQPFDLQRPSTPHLAGPQGPSSRPGSLLQKKSFEPCPTASGCSGCHTSLASWWVYIDIQAGTAQMPRLQCVRIEKQSSTIELVWSV